MDIAELRAFQRESNRIEGIKRETAAEVRALETFVKQPIIMIADLCAYVAVIQPNARLRDDPSVPGVRVGRHVAPLSGPAIVAELRVLLNSINPGAAQALAMTPFEAHCLYETLHPFTDGNGRSGRALWLWMHRGQAPLGFLHTFYYETLDSLR